MLIGENYIGVEAVFRPVSNDGCDGESFVPAATVGEEDGNISLSYSSFFLLQKTDLLLFE